MKVPRHVLAKTIAKRTLELDDTKALAKEIAAYLLAEGRVSELESILRDVMQYRADHSVIEAEVASAHKLSPDTLDEVKQLLTEAYPAASDIQITSRLDPGLIGGILINMANEQLDMSVAAKLAKFKRSLAGQGNI